MVSGEQKSKEAKTLFKLIKDLWVSENFLLPGVG